MESRSKTKHANVSQTTAEIPVKIVATMAGREEKWQVKLVKGTRVIKEISANNNVQISATEMEAVSTDVVCARRCIGAGTVRRNSS